MDTKAKVSVCIKLIVNLLKLKPKADKTMTVIAIVRVEQKSLRNIEIVTIKVMN